MELISREEAMRLAENGRLLSGSFGERAKDIIKALPAIEERKEGEWIKVKTTRGGYECSKCHNYAPSYQGGSEHLSNYCPNCGARMKGDIR